MYHLCVKMEYFFNNEPFDLISNPFSIPSCTLVMENCKLLQRPIRSPKNGHV